MLTSDIKKLLRNRYQAPAHAIFFEVPDATGGRASGWADAVAMSLWPSRGMDIQGFEIKASRSDWQRELANPAKSEKFALRCDLWWLVTGPGVVKELSEVPSGWGWLECVGDKITIKQEAPKREALPVDRLFLAALFRSAQTFSSSLFREAVEKEVNARRQKDEERQRVEIERIKNRAAPDSLILEKLRTTLACADNGNFGHYFDDNQIVEAIVAVLKSGVTGIYNTLEATAVRLEETAVKIREAHQALQLPAHSAANSKRGRAA